QMVCAMTIRVFESIQKHVWAGIDSPQHTVGIEGSCRSGCGESTRDDELRNLSLAYRLLGFPHRVEEIFLMPGVLNLRGEVLVQPASRSEGDGIGYRLGEALHHAL